MNQSFDIAVVGATGLVGEALLIALDERDFPVGTLHALAAADAAGQVAAFRERNLRVQPADGFDFASVSLVFLLEPLPAAQLARIEAAGCALVDLAGVLDLQRAPCVVAEVNPQQAESARWLRSPLPAVVALASVLGTLRQVVELRRVTLTACLAVSSRGRDGIEELARQTAQLLNARPVEPQLFDRQIAFNLLARASAELPDGHARDERRLAGELGEVLGEPTLPVAATCVQAPVFFGDSLAVSLLCAEPVDLAVVRHCLDDAEELELVEQGDYPTAVGDALGQDLVYVGRLRAGQLDPCELNLWIASDNVRKGSALNAVRLAELLLKHTL
ncbi:USG-1 protein homolog [Pseudomonas sp. OF001]|uniref:aspartate-semialdehyde dehydrogenase n=1 Tax=Pseudomonas sp. OF001 TaxID=2772300 RepID=UPI00191AEE53|nr:aspartate-semialdehyde dehydrogenase [Pseudomonas sp. OF001]CAD5376518.1 USG-1 protein homolog [Pseudomonas sp. OF001]